MSPHLKEKKRKKHIVCICDMTSPKGGVSEVDLQDCVPIDDCNDLVQGAIGCLNEAVDDTHPKIERTNDSVHIEYETTAKVCCLPGYIHNIFVLKDVAS